MYILDLSVHMYIYIYTFLSLLHVRIVFKRFQGSSAFNGSDSNPFFEPSFRPAPTCLWVFAYSHPGITRDVAYSRPGVTSI